MRRNSSLVAVLILMVLLLVEPAAAGRKSRRKQNRRKQTRRDTCEPKYLELSPTHTRCLTDNVNARLVTLSSETKEDILDMHNEIRAMETPTASDMMKLVWDDDLALTAEKLAMQCAGQHDNMIDRTEPDWPLLDIGQNIGTGHRTFRVMLDRFYSEKERFNYTYGGGYIVGSGHFFQLVSAKTSRLGCAEVQCPHTAFKTIRVCNYAPALDASRPPYQNGTHCGDCPDHCDASGKLCDCGAKLCYNAGDLDPSTCQCVCQQGWTGENCETLDCDNPDPVPSCRAGIITKEQCGQPGSVVHDPNMCPHLCDLCPKACGGLECQNGGTLDLETCTCDCPELLTGDACELCPTMDKSYCTTFKPREYCDTLYVGDCPIYCGKCQTTCEPCENLGDLNTDDCSCKCKGGFTGSRCEICPDEDNAQCRYMSAAHCTQIPYYWSFMQTSCPHLCGICTAA